MRPYSRWGLVGSVLLSWACLGPPAAHAIALDVQVEPSTWLLVDIRLNGRTLPDFQDVLRADTGQLWLPIEVLVQAAEGTFEPLGGNRYRLDFGANSNALEFDLDRQTARLNQQPEPWPTGLILDDMDQLFLAAELLDQWFGLRTELSPNLLSVSVDSERPLPADLRRLRERRWARFDQPEFRIDPSFVPIEEPYSLWGTPRGNVSLSTRLDPNQDALNLRYATSMDVEAARISNRVFFSGDVESGLQAVRWTGSRSSPEGNVFGWSDLHRVEFGDVSSFRLPLQTAGGSGRGVQFSTAPTDRPDLFDITTLAGDALPGWDAELYRGNELIDFMTVDEAGRFEFSDVPLGFGNNDLRVVLYGPQGQQEERAFRNRVAAGQLAPDEFHLRGSVVELGTRMIPIRQDNESGAMVYNLRGDYGLSTDLTVGAFMSLTQLPERRLGSLRPLVPTDTEANIVRANYGLSLRPRIADADTELIVVSQDGREMAFQGNVRGPIGGSQLTTGYEQYSEGFLSSQRAQSGGLINSRWRLRSSHSLDGLGTVSLGYERSVLRTGTVRQVFSPRLRHRWRGVAFSHEADYSWQHNSEQLRYRLLGSWRHQQWTTRAQFTAAGANPSELTAQTLSGTADYRLDDRQSISTSASWGFHSERFNASTRYIYSQTIHPGRLSFSTGINLEGHWSAALSYTVGLGSDANQPLRLLPHDNNSGGGFSMRVFEDRSQTGDYDSDVDVPISGAGVRVNNRPAAATSDDEGWLMVAGLPTHRRVAIALDPNTLDDPFLVPSQPRVQFLPRPGFTHHVDMPLLDSGFADGTVVRMGRPVAGLSLVAERRDGGAREQTFSMSEGYFSFDILAPGAWQVQIDPTQVPEGWTSTVATFTIEEGLGVQQLQIELLPLADPEAAQP